MSRVKHLNELYTMFSVDDVKYEGWNRTRPNKPIADKPIADRRLRHGYNKRTRDHSRVTNDQKNRSFIGLPKRIVKSKTMSGRNGVPKPTHQEQQHLSSKSQVLGSVVDLYHLGFVLELYYDSTKNLIQF
ncbi:hypothetical protein F5Y13DRAFT_187008 [Hypoxylon sp. FL1857]|nr:hypothetical protein F5Y13DRAFT_187008 [Hypoxylon sp. FL1857]